MDGPQILAHSLSKPQVVDRYGNHWCYFSRSDRHSKISCWAAVYDLLGQCALLRQHVIDGKVAFGINHEMVDFERNRRKNLDLVICTPSSIEPKAQNFVDLVPRYGIELSQTQRQRLLAYPKLLMAPVGSVLVALEAKACMTSHQKALPRLYDELNSSHLTVHGASSHAVAVGLVMINIADNFLSSDQNKEGFPAVKKWSRHVQPRAVEQTLLKLLQLPRRTLIDQPGFDALGVVVINCVNDGSAVQAHNSSPAPQERDIIHYKSAIERISNLYSTRFGQL